MGTIFVLPFSYNLCLLNVKVFTCIDVNIQGEQTYNQSLPNPIQISSRKKKYNRNTLQIIHQKEEEEQPETNM